MKVLGIFVVLVIAVNAYTPCAVVQKNSPSFVKNSLNYEDLKLPTSLEYVIIILFIIFLKNNYLLCIAFTTRKSSHSIYFLCNITLH